MHMIDGRSIKTSPSNLWSSKSSSYATVWIEDTRQRNIINDFSFHLDILNASLKSQQLVKLMYNPLIEYWQARAQYTILTEKHRYKTNEMQRNAFFLIKETPGQYIKMTTFTFAKGRWAIPLRGMTRNTANNDLTNEFIALVTEETQSLSCLVAVLVQGLVTIVRDTRVWTRVIFYCSVHTETHMLFQFISMCAAVSITPAGHKEDTYRHTLGCGHSIWGCQCLDHGKRFGWDLPVGNPGYRRNGPLFQLQNLLQDAQSVLRLPPLLDQDTVGLSRTRLNKYDSD